ncbi:polyketide cyclase [Agrobacterium vitis]|uniref:Activator of Hsp90 ATPase homologue 1/2-like C-terminal domain-containing protein n=3 Tax=Rhizobium/Agrobacterium group TaxID=227290 RepID=B9JVU5_ALLAM|nr:Conserved hypothetical protein [Allorhizobium ampelinum S4]MCF1449761.1 SRPBCC family protein [Allorhizobium ampelinum]MUO27742.1 polyketide cyclase [Agrobacterium vitis]MCF1494735.1 SRPBCC family protein [Allorhizobium ampelinum]MUO44198.1 polyketide cyclase [Agrobacterium vitis]
MGAKGLGMAFSIRVDKLIQAPISRVYKAFLDEQAVVQWMQRKDFTCQPLHFDGREGGGYRIRFSSTTSDLSYVMIGEFDELVLNERIRYTERMDDPFWTARVETVIQLKPTARGTDLSIVQSGIPDTVSQEGVRLAWDECLRQLACLVEQLTESLHARTR